MVTDFLIITNWFSKTPCRAMMLELVKLLILAILCSSTQGKACPNKRNQKYCSISLGKLVQGSGNSAICSDNVAVFWCSNDNGFLNWNIRTTGRLDLPFFLSNDDPVGSTRNGTLNSSLVIAQVTFINGSFINGTVTIMRPINLNGSTIRCNTGILTLNIPTKIGKFLAPVTNTFLTPHFLMIKEGIQLL